MLQLFVIPVSGEDCHSLITHRYNLFMQPKKIKKNIQVKCNDLGLTYHKASYDELIQQQLTVAVLFTAPVHIF